MAIFWKVLRYVPSQVWLIVVLIAVLVGQAWWYSIRYRHLEAQSGQQIAALQAELAQARGAIQQLANAAATLHSGETRTITVDRPVPIPIPGKSEIVTVERQVPVVVTRTERTVETKVETLTLPPKEIERIIRESPQSIVATMTALRDIKAGERFEVTLSQIQPGVWQPLVTPDSPVGIEAKVVTPVDSIPTPVMESRWRVFLYGGYSTESQWVTGVRAQYRLTSRLHLEGQVEHRWQSGTQDYRLTFGWTF